MSRNVNPIHTGVITVGAIHSGEAPNVTPGVAELRLTVRAFRPEVRDLLKRRINEVAHAQAAEFDATAEVRYQRRYPMLHNHAAETARCTQVITHQRGPEGMATKQEPLCGAEDFACFVERVPGCYVFLGNGEGVGGGCMRHNASYDFNDRVLSTGATYWVKFTEAYLCKA